MSVCAQLLGQAGHDLERERRGLAHEEQETALVDHRELGLHDRRRRCAPGGGVQEGHFAEGLVGADRARAPVVQAQVHLALDDTEHLLPGGALFEDDGSPRHVPGVGRRPEHSQHLYGHGSSPLLVGLLVRFRRPVRIGSEILPALGY